MKMRSILILYLCLASISTVGHSQQEESVPKVDPVRPSEQPETKPLETPQNIAPVPATPFTPTEKIRADDAVAFPVDI